MVSVDGTDVECATCGAAGRLAVQDGEPLIRFDDPAGLERSIIWMAEKRAHFLEVQETAAAQRPLAEEIARARRVRRDRPAVTHAGGRPRRGDRVAEHVVHRDRPSAP